MINIETYKFQKGVEKKLKDTKFGNKWPIVYVIHDKKEAYVGETTNAYVRVGQHLENPQRQNLKLINIISSEKFNKSVTLDLEAFLIKYMAADQTFKLQNGNNGLHSHNYYERDSYRLRFREIWEQLRKIGIVKNDLMVIENSNLFKYSPYKSLTDDQYKIINEILKALAEDIKLKKKSISIVHGGAGTGKTILGVYLIKLLSQIKDNYVDVQEDSEESIEEILKMYDSINKLKIGLVIPMDNLRATLKKVFRTVKGLNSKMVLSPNDVAKSNEKYDILIVDEAHRLRKRKNLTQYRTFDRNNEKFNLGKDGTELDWIRLQSKHQILLYDDGQTIKPTDINREVFENIEKDENTHKYLLQTQLRCLLGGNEYVEYVKEIFSNNPPKKKRDFLQYDFKIFDDIDQMINNIKSKNEVYGLCRTVAGYAWKWNSKGKKLPLHSKKRKASKDIEENELYDIEIDGHRYIWNSQAVDWINSPNSINEIGSIHTTQGFDLNYTGLIIGNDLKYDNVNRKIYVDRKEYYDVKGKSDTSDEELLKYVLNIYATMCTRGMRGTYLYICDENLRRYLSKYVSKYGNKNTYCVREDEESYELKLAEDDQKYDK